MNKKVEKIKIPKKKMILGILLLMLLIASYFIQYTILMRNYTISYAISVLHNNTINIIVIAILLIVMNIFEIKIIRKKTKNKI